MQALLACKYAHFSDCHRSLRLLSLHDPSDAAQTFTSPAIAAYSCPIYAHTKAPK